MAITTYAELKAAVADWLQRDDLADVVPSFVALAEAQLFRTARIRQMLVRATAVLDEEYESLPDDFLEAVSLKLATSPPLLLMGIALDAMERRKEDGAVGMPEVYAVVGASITVHPAPAAPQPVELIYYARPAPLSDAAPVNALLRECPDLYLYGSLLQAAPYLLDDARLAIWEALYGQRLDALEVADHASRAGTARLVTEIGLAPRRS
ncbi:phage adaptor protein [Arenibaculum pallidiluteum]|uniref:phage adaptor protein n=1 Tax=Arenibaculum pallidiluteum TaxID=2812559 RepID=UPI001A964D3C|nr:hypothetical protein [Arenibaculum pallidiluteum]